MSLRNFLGLLSAAALLGGCGPQPVADPRVEFSKAARLLNMQPVYPPRQYFRPGEVYMLLDEKDGIGESAYVGYMPGVERAVEAYGRGVVPLHVDGSKVAAAREKMPFRNPTAFETMTYPSITVSSAKAGAFGAVLPGASTRFGFGSNKSVTIGFENTMQYGIPSGRMPGSAFERELRDLLWQNPNGICHNPPVPAHVGPMGEQIPATGFRTLRIVTGIIVSDGITFTYNSSRSGGAAAGVGPTAAGAAPGINLNVNIGGLATQEQAQAALQSVQAGQVASVLVQDGNTITISKPASGYVVVAYTYYDVIGARIDKYCN